MIVHIRRTNPSVSHPQTLVFSDSFQLYVSHLLQNAGKTIPAVAILKQLLALARLRLALNDTICLTDSFQFWPGHCFSFKAIRHEWPTLNGIVTDKSHRVIVVLQDVICLTDSFELLSDEIRVNKFE